MKKILSVLIFSAGQIAFAQQSVDSYIFKVDTGKVYSPLTAGTNINTGLLLGNEKFKVPLGFSANIGEKSISHFAFFAGYGFGLGSDTVGIINAFFSFGATAMVDRGFISGTPKSFLRYLIAGIEPNRIFKFEAYNIGFYDEIFYNSSLNDSINIQIWLYEGSNIVELRFGNSKITFPADYFLFGKSTLVHYLNDYNLKWGGILKGYSLIGNPSSPNLDSATSVSGITTGLDLYPASGTVYRFIPKTVAASIGESTIATKFQVYPTFTTDNITVLSTHNAATTARIIDQNGRLVSFIEHIEKGTNTIDVSHFASGNYVLEMANAEGKAVYKFTKQ